VLSGGKVVEHGDVRQVFTAPQHPYTRRLIAAVPRLTPSSAPPVPPGDAGSAGQHPTEPHPTEAHRIDQHPIDRTAS
jgi:peptide/nickel transport system ATP-binding protein